MVIVREHHFNRAATKVLFAIEYGRAGVFVDQKRSETGRVAEHFVKRNGDKVGCVLVQVQVVGGHVSGRV